LPSGEIDNGFARGDKILTAPSDSTRLADEERRERPGRASSEDRWTRILLCYEGTMVDVFPGPDGQRPVTRRVLARRVGGAALGAPFLSLLDGVALARPPVAKSPPLE